MIPAKKVYFLLTAGIFIAPILSMIVGIFPTIIITCLFDLTVFILMVVDGWGMKANRVQITRELPSRLSIGRDNPVILKVQGGKIDTVIKIRDYYPAEFAVSTPTVTANINANQTQELTYTVYPNQRGEFAWGNMQVRQLGMWCDSLLAESR
jgi:uncharacterized protein (DUF58 family)